LWMVSRLLLVRNFFCSGLIYDWIMNFFLLKRLLLSRLFILHFNLLSFWFFDLKCEPNFWAKLRIILRNQAKINNVFSRHFRCLKFCEDFALIVRCNFFFINYAVADVISFSLHETYTARPLA